MREKLFFWLGAMLCCTAPAIAQDVLRGRVLDKQTSEPVVGAAVFIPGTNDGVSTDPAGCFTLNPVNPADSVEIRCLGYISEKFRIQSGLINHIFIAPSARIMDEIVVTASRESQRRAEVPMAISKISGSVINDTKPVLLTELLNKVSGVTMLNLNNEQHGMGIRQPMGTANYFLYMEDGIPMRPMGVFNHNALIEMNLFAVSSIEIVKGPASSLYGPEAVGGAINFITQKPTAVFTAKAGVQADNLGYKRLQYGSGGMITKKLGFYAGGYYAFQKNGWMSNSDYDKNSVNLRFDYDLTDKTKLTIAGAYNKYFSETGGNVDSTSFYSREYVSSSDFTYRKVNSLRVRFSIDHKWNHNHSTLLHVFYRDNAIEQNPAYAIRWTSGKTTATGQINLNSLSSRGFIAQHFSRIDPLKTKVIAGVSLDNSPNTYHACQVDLNAELRSNGLSVNKYTISALRPDLLLADYSAMIWNYAAYCQAETRLLKQLTMTLGGRYDVMSFSYTNRLDNSNGEKLFAQFSPKVGATYKISDQGAAYLNYAKGFSPPGLTTVFTKKPNTNPAEFYYDLAPAEFTNYEVGGWANLFKSKLSVEVSLYLLMGKNELLNVRQPDNSTDYQSAGKTEHKGIEYTVLFRPADEFSFRFSGCNAIHRYNEFTLSAKPGEIKDVNGKLMPSAPCCVTNSEFIYKPAFVKGLRVGIEWQYMGSWYQDQVNNFKYQDKGAFGLKGISVLNFRTGYSLKSLEFFVNIMNLTDELYAFNVQRGNTSVSRSLYTPAPPGNFVMGFQYNFSGKK